MVENEIIGNGGMAYGLERGGINLEHASGNRILGNLFRNNKCAIHLWWDNDGALLSSPGVAGNDRGVSSNVIAKNTFLLTADHPFRNLRPAERLVVLQLRDEGTNRVRNNLYFGNRVTLAVSNAVELEARPGIELITNGTVPAARFPHLQRLGRSRPVGSRTGLRGRDQIILGEWGPWDHESPLLRPRRSTTGSARYEISASRNGPSSKCSPARFPRSSRGPPLARGRSRCRGRRA